MDTTITTDHLLSRLRWRYATKQFDTSRPLTDDQLSALGDALVLTASSGGLQPWKFILITDPEVRARLRPASYEQAQVTDASALVVMTAATAFSEKDVDAHIARTAELRGTTPETLKGFRDMLAGGIVGAKSDAERRDWAARQTYIALGSLLTSAALIGIDACPMEGFSPADYDRILGIDTNGFTAVAICALGHRKADDPYASAPKIRFPKDAVLVRV